MTPEKIKEARDIGTDVEVDVAGTKVTGKIVEVGNMDIKKGIGTLRLKLVKVETTNGDVYSHIKDIYPKGK